ncbi:hypothetical protein PFICI_07699 [Pestalotiopsis fici W106-1]|uniref:Uncharacterized protein n=1 Tax=Pestalotiopsis fici (strain W106-1 / CGMCC3.15140) TaxID=1229662 RepID=W3X264_PESFW|nr:uncharacterized protein PFICI_07699 [Pestalotiopsis fici W106-1]ETS80170.1 hypothetical protein PFICI_07699 [Pestalotiopsis fici W106-1]
MARLRSPRRMIVERAPSHDGLMAVTAYLSLDNDERTAACKMTKRPLFAFRIYDTRPEAANVDSLCHVATAIYENTLEGRSGSRTTATDRIEVIALPMSADATDHERAVKCREHEEAEMVSRKNPGMRDWYLHRHHEFGDYLSEVHVISRLCQDWEQAIQHVKDRMLRPEDPAEARADPFGTFITVAWDFKEDPWAQLEEDEDVPPPEMSVTPHKISYLDRCLAQGRERIDWFYNVYVPDGGLDIELEQGQVPPDVLGRLLGLGFYLDS